MRYQQTNCELVRCLVGTLPKSHHLIGKIEHDRIMRYADDAARFGVAVTTVRSQLKSLFAKIGVNRQAQLVALLAGLTLPGQ